MAKLGAVQCCDVYRVGSDTGQTTFGTKGYRTNDLIISSVFESLDVQLCVQKYVPQAERLPTAPDIHETF